MPPHVLADLRVAFGEELRERLPHLEDATDHETVRRHAHTLASGAWVVGEPEIARIARMVENDTAHGPVAELVALLKAWQL